MHSRRGQTDSVGMQLDPDTQAFVLATAFVTALTFALGMLLPVVLALRWLFAIG